VGVDIDPGHERATLCEGDRQRGVTAAHVENAQAGRWSNELQNELLFKGISDPAEPAGAPAPIGVRQACHGACRLACHCQAGAPTVAN
jgi:hypothetical protein